MLRMIESILRHRRILAIASLVSLLIPAWFAPRLRIDNSLEVWLGRGSQQYREYRQFLHRYGTDEFVVVAARMPDPLSPSALEAQRELAAAIRAIEGVSGVLDLPAAYPGLALLSPAVRPQDHPLLRNLIVSADGRTAGVVAWVRPLRGPDVRRRVVEAVRRASESLTRRGFEPHLIGAPVMNAELDRISTGEARTLLPIAAALSALVLLLMLHSLTATVACLMAAGGTVLWTLGLMAMTGRSLNMVTAALPSLLLVLALSPGIHLAARYLAAMRLGTSKEQALQSALHELMAPMFLTVITTLIGFASLAVTDMEPVFELGVFAAMGMILSLVLNVAIVPGIVAMAPIRCNSPSQAAPLHATSVIAGFTTRHRFAVCGVSVLAVFPLAWLAKDIRAESNVLSFFPSHSLIVRDYQFVSQNLTGLYTLELDITAPAAQEQRVLGAIQQLADDLESRPDVARVDHYGRFAPLLERAQILPPLPPTASSVQSLHEAVARYRVFDGDHVHLRVSVLARRMASGDFYNLVQAVRDGASTMLPQGLRWGTTGAVLLLNNAQVGLIRTQMLSLAIAGVAVLAVMGFVFRSWRVVGVSLVPNLLPVLATFALMARRNIPIDPATVMIASVAVGLAVDSTIHFLVTYRQAHPARGPAIAAAMAMSQCGRPIVYTTAVAAAGFALLCLARFRPLAYFGLLSSGALLMAAACDIAITPAWAGLFRLWEDSDGATLSPDQSDNMRPTGATCSHPGHSL